MGFFRKKKEIDFSEDPAKVPDRHGELYVPEKKELRTCDICHERGSAINPKKMIIEVNKDKFHRECYEEQQALIKESNEANREFKSKQNFSKIKFNFENELEALIEIIYFNPAQSKVRLFFGKEGKETIYSRDYLETSKNNFVHIKILPSHKQYSTQWIKDGTQDVGDNFEAGYTIEILLRTAEPQLRKYLIDILSSNGFGCLPAARTIHAHLDDANPNEGKAKEILANILDKISEDSKNS